MNHGLQDHSDFVWDPIIPLNRALVILALFEVVNPIIGLLRVSLVISFAVMRTVLLTQKLNS